MNRSKNLPPSKTYAFFTKKYTSIELDLKRKKQPPIMCPFSFLFLEIIQIREHTGFLLQRQIHLVQERIRLTKPRHTFNLGMGKLFLWEERERDLPESFPLLDMVRILGFFSFLSVSSYISRPFFEYLQMCMF